MLLSFSKNDFMKGKLKIGLVFGGKSGEHEVSLAGGRSIYNALDKEKYDITLIGIDKKGCWHLGDPKNIWLNPESIKTIKLNANTPKITAISKNGKVKLMNLKDGKLFADIDIFFPKTSGTFGEDGCLQGFFELLGAAYVGSGVLGSAVGMDKDLMKRVLRHAGIRVAKFYILRRKDLNGENLSLIAKDLKFPIFAKPCNLGSSVGISKPKNIKELNKAVKMAFQYDNKIILEEAIKGREIECAILGNEKPIASVPGEIKLKEGHFYSYHAKYINEEIAAPTPRADLPVKTIKKIQETAIRVFKVLNCEGMGRVDFFLTESGKLYVNEINTLPGFTSVSMYPKMFEASGIPYPELLDKLIHLGMERKKRDDKLKRDYNT